MMICEYCGEVDPDVNEVCVVHGRRRHRLVSSLRPAAGLGNAPVKRQAPKAQRSGFTPASVEQRSAVSEMACVVCASGPCHPAHVIDRKMLSQGQEDERAVIPLCPDCHRRYDDGDLSVLEALEPLRREELSFAVLRFGLLSTLERVTNQRWQPVPVADRRAA